jgi:transcriptional regulator with PAS, ATPase and Fis domain
MTLEPADLGLGVRVTDDNEVLRAMDLSGSLSEVSERASRYVERRKIAEALKTNDGNKSRTAEDLGVSYKTLLTKIKDYDL